jgi:methylated-DNA-[protein]-cysteine S-methyltransferase
MDYVAYYDSPVGLLKLIADDTAIIELSFEKNSEDNIPFNSISRSTSPIINQCIVELNEYFTGNREVFNVQIKPLGTPFQERVWNKLLSISFAKTVSYASLATELGDIKSIRAVGTANGKNPIAILIPCHRVIGSNGHLVGYGGGLWRKKWLLDFESKRKQGELFG